MNDGAFSFAVYLRSQFMEYSTRPLELPRGNHTCGDVRAEVCDCDLHMIIANG